MQNRRFIPLLLLGLQSVVLAVAGQGTHPVEGLVTIKSAPALITVGGADADLPAYTSRAIQLAVDALTPRGGGTVRLGAGTFEMTGPVRLTSNVTLEGSGPDTVLRKSDGVRTRFVVDADYGMLKISVEDPTGFGAGTGIELYDDENDSAWDVSTAVVTAVAGDVLFLDRPTVRDYRAELNGVVTNAFSIIEGVGVENVRIANLVVDGNRATNDYINGCRGGGIYLHKARDCSVEGVLVRDFHGDSFSWQTTEAITIRGCEAANGGGLGFHPGTGSDGTLMEDCVSHHNDEDGIFLCWRVQNGTFRRNRSYANERFGISIGHQDTDNLFEDNVIAENGRHGICFRNETEANGAHRNTLRRNVIENNGSPDEAAYGVFIGGSTHDIRLEANTIRSTGVGNQVAAVFVGTRVGSIEMEANQVSGHPEVVREGLPARAASRKPNIVFILADDLGYGDLGCYGQPRIATPSIDRLASEGMRFTQFYAGSTVCAPSRSVLMTGQHTGHTLIRGNLRVNLRPEDTTVAEILGQAGYATGLAGKWGLGQEGSSGLPTRQGFDSFFGYLDQVHAHNYYPSFLIRDERRVPLPNVVPNEREDGGGVASERIAYSHDLITAAALSFIERHRAEPFFLYLAYTLPHANNEAGTAGMEVPEYVDYATESWPQAEKGFAAMVSRLDRDVGRIREKLDELGLGDDTIVFFTSDNGPHREGGHDPDFFDSNGPLRGIKRDLYEGGIRVPMIVSWPNRIAAGTVSHEIGYFGDFLPTAVELAGAGMPPGIDGISLLPVLLDGGRAQGSGHEFLYWEFYEGETAQAVRMGDWKGVRSPMLSGTLELYDLRSDLGEQEDVVSAHPEIAEKVEAIMQREHAPSDYWSPPSAPGEAGP